MTVNISEAKTHLSKLVDKAYHGEKIIIAKNNTPLAELVAHTIKAPRKLGLCKKKISIPQDFDDAEIQELFYRGDM